MGVSFDEAATAQAAIEDNLLKDPNIVSVGVVEEVVDTGEKTGNYVVQVGIVSSEVYQSALEKGAQPIAGEYVLTPQNNSSVKGGKHVRILVVKEGQIQALSATSKVADLTSAGLELPSSGLIQGTWTLRLLPSPCRPSISHPTSTAGTMGLLLRYSEGPDTQNAYVLSNNHVIAANSAGNIGDEIIQPSQAEDGRIGDDTIAYLHRWVLLDSQKRNYADAAVALLRGNKEWRKFATPYISAIGYPQEMSRAAIGMIIEKTGGTTGHTHGEVVSVNETIKVNYGPLGLLIFKGQIPTTLISQGGNSGSALIEKATKSTIRIFFVGSSTASYHNHIDIAVDILSQPHENKHVSNITKFSNTFPFTIIKRKVSTAPLLQEIRSQVWYHSVKNGNNLSSARFVQHATLFSSHLKSTYRQMISRLSRRL